jgi:SET domain-containing protein
VRREKEEEFEALPIETRDSGIHGHGVYATRRSRRARASVEYLGRAHTHAEADRRYARKGDDDGHTFLFIASRRTVIDAGVNGNAARFINSQLRSELRDRHRERPRVHRVDPRIKPGEELGYDYQLTWESTDDPVELALYACRCGAKRCRGTMLDTEPTDKK